MPREYIQSQGSATVPVTNHTKRKSLPLSEKFLRRGQSKVTKGEDATHWFKAAEIAWRLENDLPVGNQRRKAEKWLKMRRAA